MKGLLLTTALTAAFAGTTNAFAVVSPAVAAVREPKDESLRNSANASFVDAVAEMNVHMALENIRSQSKILSDMEKIGEIAIVGGMYDVSTGAVDFFDE